MHVPDYLPIADAPLDGRTLVIADDTGTRAVSYWTGDMWALGRNDEGHPVEQVDFDPTTFTDPSTWKD